MPVFSEHIVFIFFTGCLFMAFIYHVVLFIIQRTNLLLYYSAYLLASTTFLAERVSLDFIYDSDKALQNSFYFNMVDEPIQMMMYFTYMLFAAKAINIFNIANKKFITFYKFVLGIILLYLVIHVAGIIFHWFDKRTVVAFVGIRIILMASLVYLLVAVSKYIRGLFFKIILAGSVILFTGNLLGFITSVTDKPIFGIYGVMWTCLALVLDVTCFSAALGYKARQDLIEKQVALKELLLKEKQLQQQELEKMNAIYKARDADRSRIARDLHDEIGSTLSSIHIYSSVAEKMMQSDPERTKQILSQININTRTVMENMNDIVWAMKTGDQQDILLSIKIKNMGYELLNAKNVNCRYEIAPQADHADLEPELRRNILLIIKESLNNIVKYSQAVEVIIQLNITGTFLNLSIKDNGKGFDVETIQKGNGLQNIQYRVKQCGGNINIVAADNEGTSIICHFPVTTFSDNKSFLED